MEWGWEFEECEARSCCSELIWCDGGSAASEDVVDVVDFREVVDDGGVVLRHEIVFKIKF